MRQTGRSVPKILPLRKTVITVITAFLGYADRRLALPCRTRRAFPAERRPKFISVAVWGARFWECSTLSIRFNLCGNCYKFLLNGEEPLTCILCELSLQLSILYAPVCRVSYRRCEGVERWLSHLLNSSGAHRLVIQRR